MMQQPVYQPEQAGNQGQQQQQMLLCPVRLVYETQILVQPGDQIRPNQTILINPPNQPPWAQNRQNPVIYVQNVPNNFMPQVHQQLDQNQMFLQQNYGYPQVIQHPMLTQNQDQIRTLQVSNVPASLQSQMQPNLPQIMPSESMVAHNYGHIQVNPGINLPNNAQNQIANVPINTNNRQIQNVPKTVHEIPNNAQKPQEVSAQNYRQIVSQHIANQINLSRNPMTQAIAMIQVPNMIHKAPNIHTHPAIEHNTAQQQMNIQQQAIVPASAPAVQQTFSHASTSTNTQIEPRKAIPIVQKTSHTVTNAAVNHPPKNQAYSYRPIQPRPQQFRNNVSAPAMVVQPSVNTQIQPSPNITEVNRVSTPNVVNTATNYPKVDNNTQFNRKRKSESPDELQRKLTIVPASQTITTTNSITVKRIDNPIVSHSISVTKVNTNEIGVNTTPMIKMNPKITTNTRSMIQISPIIDQNVKIKEELAKPVPTPPTVVAAPTVKPPITVTNITNSPTSHPPTGHPSTSQPPSSHPPTNHPPTGHPPTSQPPSSHPPTSHPLTGHPPTSHHPTSHPPSGHHPTNHPPSGHHPTNHPPTSHPLTGHPPISHPPTSHPPTSHPPTSHPPTSHPPTSHPPTSHLPISHPLTSHPPTIHPPAVHPPTVHPPTAHPPTTANTASQVEKEKLVRNTVFTQARFGRLLTDKDDIPVNINAAVTKEPPKVEPEIENTKAEAVKTENVPVPEVKNEVNEPIVERKQEEIARIAPVVKEEKPVQVERNAEEKMLSDSMNRLKGTESNETRLKNEKDYILTHVLDGFVIQESNVAFPIRLPLKEKTLAINAEAKRSAEMEKTESKSRVPDLSHLNLSEKERLKKMKNDVENNMQSDFLEGNPFTDLNPCAVKLWTVEQLGTHLSKFDWADTISVLQEHEIDGESLFLVSKSQLLSIGVDESHADLICDFVRH